MDKLFEADEGYLKKGMTYLATLILIVGNMHLVLGNKVQELLNCIYLLLNLLQNN